MKTNHTQEDTNAYVLSTILSGDRPIENLIRSLITKPSLTLVFGPDGENENAGNLMMLVDKDNVLAGSEIDLGVLTKKYKKVDSYFEPIVLADTGKTRLAIEDTEKHREKNGVRWNEVSRIFEINPSFVGNLCLSYLINNRASIKITLDFFEDDKYWPKYYYVIEIIYLGEIPGYEKYAVLKDRLLKYVRIK